MARPTVGSTFVYELGAILNGESWDLSLATVTLLLRKPDHRTLLSIPAPVTDGIARAPVIHDTSGTWRHVWRVEEGDVLVYSRSFPVQVDSGALEPRRTIPGVTQAVC